MTYGDNKYRTFFVATLLVAIVLIGVLVYMVFLKPTIQGYAVEKQVEGANFAVSNIISQIQQQGFAQISLGDNQSLFLAPFDPQQTGSQ